jgi:hypothetical protein
MSAKDKPELRGEAAWRAQRAEIAKRNEAACAAGAQRRAAKEAEDATQSAREEARDARAARRQHP